MLAITNKVNDLLVDALGGTEICLTKTCALESLGIDSIERVELLVNLQKVFCIKLDFDEFQSLVTLDDLYHYINKKVQ